MKKEIQKGFTLIEMLVVVLTIAIIALALIPVVTQRVEKARIATARTEVKELAMAEDSCAITTGFYVPLQVLDDIKFHKDLNDDSLDREPFLRTYTTRPPVVTILLINPFYQYIEWDPVAKTTTINANPVQEDMVNQTDESQIYRRWDGSYTSYAKTLLNLVFPSENTSLIYDSNFDYPLDPWNVPYRFFSPIGIIGTYAYTNETDLEQILMTIDYNSGYNFSDGKITTNLLNYTNGRWAIVSPGPNRRFISTNDQYDDIVHFFGLAVHETNYFVRRF